ncbi:MAG TPA: hypothetical protein VEF03_11300 [Candidatus Binataceae bacterium]|nr:hypothetical protein [Candidatus Binataceae bacterium]
MALATSLSACAAMNSPALQSSAAFQGQTTSVSPAGDSSNAGPLPYKGRLVQGDPDELPPSVRASLSDSSPLQFSYREDLTHDEHHTPLIISALNPATYAGASLGEYEVTAFASFSIADGARVLGDYTAKVSVSSKYSLYSEPTHREVEREARDAVRKEIDAQVHRDQAHVLAQISASSGTE